MVEKFINIIGPLPAATYQVPTDVSGGMPESVMQAGRQSYVKSRRNFVPSNLTFRICTGRQGIDAYRYLGDGRAG